MPDLPVRCPFCRRPLVSDGTAGFPFIRTIISVHVDGCAYRPDGIAREERLKLADDLASAAIALLPSIS